MGVVGWLLCPFYMVCTGKSYHSRPMAAIFRRACWQGCLWLASGSLAYKELPMLIGNVPDTGKAILSTSGTKHLLPAEIPGIWHLPVRECLHDYPPIKPLNSEARMGFLRRDLHRCPCMFTVREGSTPGGAPPGLAGTVSKAY